MIRELTTNVLLDVKFPLGSFDVKFYDDDESSYDFVTDEEDARFADAQQSKVDELLAYLRAGGYTVKVVDEDSADEELLHFGSLSFLTPTE